MRNLTFAVLCVGGVLTVATHSLMAAPEPHRKSELTIVTNPEWFGNPDPITKAYLVCIGHAYMDGKEIASSCQRERTTFGSACVALAPRVPEVCNMTDDRLLTELGLHGPPGDPRRNGY